MSKIITSLSTLNLKSPINSGSCSKIYKISPDEYFKLLNEDYRDLSEPENYEVLETLTELQGITNCPSIALPITIFSNDKELYGYTSKIMPGVVLDEIPDSTMISSLTKSLEKIKPEIRRLAEAHIKTEDIGGDNILFSDHMSIIDLELSLIDRASPATYLYSRTMYDLFIATLVRSYGANTTRTLQIEGLKKISDSLKAGTSDAYNEYFQTLNSILETKTHDKIQTISDGKLAYQKIKTSL